MSYKVVANSSDIRDFDSYSAVGDYIQDMLDIHSDLGPRLIFRKSSVSDMSKGNASTGNLIDVRAYQYNTGYTEVFFIFEI